MNFDDIIKKWNYSEEFGDFLREVYNEFVLYFGKENELVIYGAFSNTEIVLCNNIYDLLVERKMLGQEGLVKAGDYKRASGVCATDEDIIFDEATETYKIVGTKRLVGLRDFDINSVSNKATAVHEIGHMIKNYFEGVKIEGNRLITRDGLQKTIYELSNKDGVVSKKLLKEEGVGLEEGLNALLEMIIARKLYDPDYKIIGYGTVCAMASVLYDLESIRGAILSSQMKDNKDFIDSLGDDYGKIAEVFDKAYSLNLKMYADLFASDQVKKTNKAELQKVIDEFKSIMKPIYYKERRNNSARDSRS